MTPDTMTDDTNSARTRAQEPTVDGDTIRLPGIGPECPGCNGPTHAVAAEEDAARPWYCTDCGVRLTSDGEYGSSVSWPADFDPDY